MSNKYLSRRENQILWESHQSEAVLGDLKRRMGEYAFAGQYQQRPSPAEGGVIKGTWWKYYDGVPDEKLYMHIMSVDAAFKSTDTSDFVVIQRWGKSETGRMYLLENLRQRMTFIETVGAINYMRRNGDIIYVEDKANGTAIIEVLRRKVSGIIAYTPKESKESRINAVSPWIESGSVYLPRNATWLESYLKEFKYFPNGSHDDQIDATSQAILHLKDIDPAPKAKASIDRYKSFNVEEDTNDESWHKSIFKMGGEFIGF
jgi:predicted phage terminase large subunit-like protein